MKFILRMAVREIRSSWQRLLFFFLCWTIVGLLPWAAAAVLSRGRGAEWALPVAIVSATAEGEEKQRREQDGGLDHDLRRLVPQAASDGGMFWFRRNRLVGSYVRLTATSRSQVDPG